MEPQMFFRGLSFWHLCIISLHVFHQSFPPPHPPSQKQKAVGTLYKHSRGKSSDPKWCFPSMTNNPLLCKEVLQEHPDLSSTSSSYPQLACVLPAPLVQTPSIPASPAKRRREVGGRRRDQGRHCLMQCVFGCALGVASQQHQRSGAPAKRRSRA